MSILIAIIVFSLIVIVILLLSSCNNKRRYEFCGEWKDDAGNSYELKRDNTFIVHKPGSIEYGTYELINRTVRDKDGNPITCKYFNAYFADKHSFARRYELKGDVAYLYAIDTTNEEAEYYSTKLVNVVKRVNCS